MKKWLIGLACVGVMAVSAMEAMGGLIISQYYEGASNNKWIEIYNPGPGSVDLYAGGYRLGRWDNVANREAWKTGAAPGGSIVLSNTIAAGATYLVKNTSAALPAYATADLASGTMTFNGDDSVVLYTGSTYAFANVVDAFGMTASNGVDKSFVRKSTVTTGVNTDFNAADWDEFSNAAVDAAAAGTPERLGYHSTGAAVFGVTFDQTSGFTMEEGTTDAILATAANGAAPYTYAWSSTLGGAFYATNGNEFTILATAPIGDYTATVVATDNTAQTVTNSLDFSVVAAALKYGITITPATNGTVTTTPATEAAEGVTVTVNTTPAGGYRVASIAVLDATNGTVGVTGNTFTMPGSDVTVTVLFEVAPASSIIISQYTETDTGSIPKGIEVWNVSGADITFDGASNLLDVKVGSGGGAPASVVTANSGTLAAGAVWVIGTTNMNPDVVEAFLFNGDDAVVLELGGVVQDMIGTAGVDPGSAWTSNGVSTANQNIQLKAGITAGDADGWSDPSERFEYVAIGSDLTGFGIPPGGSAAFEVTVDRTDGFVVAEGAGAAIVATAANGTEPYTYGWTSTLGGVHFLADTNVFTILGTAPVGDYTATVVATDAGAQSATNIVNFSVVAPYAITITPPSNGTVATDPATEAIAGATVTITATAADGYRVASIAVVDGALNPVGVAGNTFVMPASAVTVTVLFELYDAPDVLLDFETNTTMSGSTYAAATSTVNSLSVAHDRTLRGSLANDRKNGLYAARISPVAGTNGYLHNTVAFTQEITKINFWHANYGTDNGTTFQVQVSPDGTTWADVGAVIDPESTNLTEVVLEGIPAGATYFQFVTVAGATRVNIDDIGIYFGAAAPSLTYTGSTSILLGNSFALVFTLHGATASGWEYLLESADRADVDTGSTNAFNWMPGSTGTYYLTMTALDEASDPIATREVTLTVTAPDPGDPAVVIAGSLSGTVDQAMNLSITVTNETATDWFIDLKDPDGLDDYSYDFNTPPAFILTPAKVGTYTLTATAQTGSGNYSNTVLLTVAADLPPADIGNITFLPASGNFTFVLPAGYTTPVNVYGADAALSGQSWVFSNLVEGVDYTRVNDLVTILTHDGKRQIIRIGVSSSPD